MTQRDRSPLSLAYELFNFSFDMQRFPAARIEPAADVQLQLGTDLHRGAALHGPDIGDARHQGVPGACG